MGSKGARIAVSKVVPCVWKVSWRWEWVWGASKDKDRGRFPALPGGLPGPEARNPGNGARTELLQSLEGFVCQLQKQKKAAP